MLVLNLTTKQRYQSKKHLRYYRDDEESYVSPAKVGGLLPEGWEFFKACQKPIWFMVSGTSGSKVGCFILGLLPMKCPLDESFGPSLKAMSAVKPNEEDMSLTREECKRRERERTSRPRYTSFISASKLAEDIQARAGVTITGIINLCATQRYYDAFDLFDRNIWYKWYKVEGGGQVMSDSKCLEFQTLWLDIILAEGLWVNESEYEGSEKQLFPTAEHLDALLKRYDVPVIGIHCTHGVNRTGFCVMILLLTFGLEFDKCVELFYESRGHDINKHKFLSELKSMFLASEPRNAHVEMMRNQFCHKDRAHCVVL